MQITTSKKFPFILLSKLTEIYKRFVIFLFCLLFVVASETHNHKEMANESVDAMIFHASL